jgi:hypothetical protein
LKKEINHVVRYMSEDTRNNFDNPVYSYQQGNSTTDAATLLRSGAVPKRPANMNGFNNLDTDSSSSGRSKSYTLQFDPQLMNEKNHEADLTNPNMYNYDDHLYAEIKLKAGDSGKF